ncbi:hypothetical protein F5Y13DRAFT_203342 [Hypoxylon sp. FL1857]|nr:hypothetical protein F5Y13DRAFT_203342 [Hypoxylon sp. FL1857]
MALDKDKVMSSLVDMRERYAGDETTQDHLLQMQFPRRYSPAKVANIPADDNVGSSGIDALLMVIRRIICQLPIEFRDAKSNEAIQQSEEANPLLRVAMSDFQSTDKDIVNAARYFALKAFYSDGQLKDKDLSFVALSEHGLMQKTFWRRLEFLLCKPETVIRIDGIWDWHEFPDVVDMAQLSLVTFEAGDLGQTVSDRFGFFSDEDDTQTGLMQGNKPAIIRVRYDVGSDDSKTYADLWRINVDMRQIYRTSDDGTRWRLTEEGARLTAYSLIAEVRLSQSKDPKHKDTLRMYTIDGQAIPPHNNFPSHSDERLGVANRSYMLYYAFSPVKPEGGPPSEIPFKPDMRKDLAAQEAFGSPASMPSRPTE